MIFQTKAKVFKNIEVAKNYYKIVLDAGRVAARAKPGQFIEVKVSDGEPLLRRPFGIHRAQEGRVEILFEVVGKGSMLLSGMRRGDWLDIIGPLGNGFDYSRLVRGKPAVLVAGGMGVAPLVFLAQRLAKRTSQNAKNKTLVLLGARTKDHILCEREFKDFGCKVLVSTDDGSRGFKGYVSGLLEGQVSKEDYGFSTLFACGPKPMLKAVSRICETFSLAAQLSLEAHMACGIGACLGCVVDTKDGYKRVCKEGPVFEANQILWGKE